jgi:murein DD-endopeptidase MepM/ murein hydrolase activator NlpD
VTISRFAKQRRYSKKLTALFLILLLSACLVPQKMINPVKGATEKSWNHQTFWYYPWGESVVHKGIDIFAKEGTAVIASQSGFVVYDGTIKNGGNVVIVLGPLFRFHYYAHLKSIYPDVGFWASKGDTLGFVGTSGNAKNKPPHLHYSIVTPIPYLWR